MLYSRLLKLTFEIYLSLSIAYAIMTSSKMPFSRKVTCNSAYVIQKKNRTIVEKNSIKNFID